MEPEVKKQKLNDNVTDTTQTFSVRQREEDVGMTEFVNSFQRYSGIVKQRFSDFMVRERDPSGELISLTSLEHCDQGFDTAPPPVPDLSAEQLKDIAEFAESEDKQKTLTLDVDNDKEHRRIVHEYIKVTYKNLVTSTKTSNDGLRSVVISFKTNQSQQRNSWPRDLPKYCHFVLFKQNRDTMECVSLLAKLLHVHTSCFSYAGTKDKRATCVQKLAVHNVRSKRLSGLNKRLKNMVLGNFSYVDHPLKLGELSGNEFTIIVRNVESDDARVNSGCELLKQNGFINYFGLQRFGTGSVPTHQVGKALLNNKLEEAVDMILRPRSNADENEAESKAKIIWSTNHDACAAMDVLTSRFSIEGRLLRCLSQQKKNCGKYNYLNAWQVLPRNNRLLYLHSYQSLVWNRMVSKRLQTYGFSPVIGDLVLTGTKDENGCEEVVHLNDEDVENKTYTLYDVVMPLPGYDVKYPNNEIRPAYEGLLLADGLDVNNMKHSQKDLSLAGKYRHVLAKPSDMTWTVVPYDDYTVPLVLNDHENLLHNDVKRNDVITGQYKALKLQMTLPASTYATSALREILSKETSFQAQCELNKEFLKEIK